VLALAAAKHIPVISKLVVYEPPFIVDDTRPPMPDGFGDELNRLIAEGRNGDAVKMFLRLVGAPAVATVWSKLKAVASTLPYDITLIQDYHRGRPLTAVQWADVKTPTLVAVGQKSPPWMTNATRALADVLPDAVYRTLPGQNHMVKPRAIAPVLTEFFAARD
jgi:pimeloyl-ACP methyl ester carboxylesterase